MSVVLVCVPKTIFIDGKVCREGGSVKAWVCVEKEREKERHTGREIQADVRAAHCTYTQAMTVHEKSKEEKERSNFHPERAYTFSR